MSSIGQASISIDESTRIGENAQDTANQVAGNVSDINSDNKLTPSEKIKLKQEYDKDLKLYAIDFSQLQSAGLSTTELETAMNNLTAFVTPLFQDMRSTSNVDRSALDGVFTAFATADKNASQAFTNKVEQVANDAKKAGDDAKQAGEKAQELGQEAKASAEQAKTDATQAKADALTAQQKAQSSIDQLNTHLPDIDKALSTANLVKQSVTKLSDTTEQYHNEYTTGIQNVISTVNNLEIGGRNLYVDTRDFNNPNAWSNWSNWYKTEEKFNGLTVMGTTADWIGLGQTIQAKKGETYTFSLYARYESGTGKSNMYFSPPGVVRTDIGTAKFSLNETWQRLTGTFTITADGTICPRIERTNNNPNTLLIAGIKLERGNKATDWSPAPEDLATATEFDQISDALKLTAKQTDMAKALNSITTLTETASGLQAQVNSKAGQSQVTQLADQYQAVVGSMTSSSLVPNSGYPIDTNHWIAGGGAKNVFRVAKHPFYHNGTDNTFNLINQGTKAGLECYVSSDRFPVKPNTQYSLSFKGFASSNVPNMDVWFLGRKYNSTASIGYDKHILVVDRKVLSSSQVDTVQTVFNTGDCEEGYIRFDNNGSTDGKDSSLYFTEVQVNVGTIAMPWSAPTLSQSDITASIDNIHLGVKNADGSTSTFNMNSDTILLDANKIIFNGNASIQNGTIGTAKIADAAINTAQIANGAINNAKIANASIDNAKISNVSGDKIIARSVTANKINVDDLIANGINTKTLTSVTLNTSTLTTPKLDLGMNGTFTEDFDYTQDTSLFLPKKNKGTLTFNHGVLQSRGTMQTYVNGQWGGMNDEIAFQSGLANAQWTELAPGYIKMDLFKQDGKYVAQRSYSDPTGFYYTSAKGDKSYLGNILQTAQVQSPSVLANYIGINGDQLRLQIVNNGNDYGLQVGSYAGGQAVLSDFIYNTAYSSSPNVYITPNGRLVRGTSASKYKYNIKNPDIETTLGDRLLNVHLATWNDKNAVDSYAEELNTGEKREKVSIDKCYGLIAEQLRDAGLDMFISYGKNHEIEGVQYDRAWIPLLSVIRRLNNKVNEYELRLSKLEETKK
ncbi:hypothetical protein GBP40_09475 [Pediococcus acidilactici]|uniref:phage head spike fiber domain-containing protein n=1 Tax=Pediococcus acidilactici TaxID=1254 RepID=UPI001320D777|nr:carbohydrate binding domain-containing protein [Pediococcus acidilactici]KAF0468837.1 hypothetical protein GBP06_09385 [Pediococcus acidilactici]KAF0539828.1 hypothetical protein GBP40_09475 [Pediococcus acidilactici]